MAKPLSLSLLLEQLCLCLEQIPNNRRGVACTLMGNFAHYPEDYAFTATMLAVLTGPPVSKPESKPDAKVKHLRMVQKGGAA